MAHLLRGASKIDKFTKSVHVHMVECSPTLQKLQYQTLKCVEEDVGSSGEKRNISIFAGAPVSWHATLEQVPSEWKANDSEGKSIIEEQMEQKMHWAARIALKDNWDLAIRKHTFVDILDNPGSADLSAYVDFASIRHSAEEASEDVSIHGPISQSQFLGLLGINFRVEALLQNCTEEQADLLRSGYWRLVGDGEAPFWEGPDDQTTYWYGYTLLSNANCE